MSLRCKSEYVCLAGEKYENKCNELEDLKKLLTSNNASASEKRQIKLLEDEKAN